MRPHIICHMLSSIDGKIDGTSLKGLPRRRANTRQLADN